jgi:hypothetical protein
MTRKRTTNCTGSRRFVSRRDFLGNVGGGLGAIAFADLLRADGKLPAGGGLHHPATAKRVLMLFMSAGVSQVDTFDHKPELDKHHGKKITGKGNVQDLLFHAEGNLMRSSFNFKQYGQSGKWVSELFPHVGEHVDNLTFIHSMVADANNHAPAQWEMSTGFVRSGNPSVGSWVTYGLGSETDNLPAFVVIKETDTPAGQAASWGAGFLPTKYQGTVLQNVGDPILDLSPPGNYDPASQRASFDFLRKLNEKHLRPRPEEGELSARIAAYELAARMQLSAPEATDIAGESEATRKLYGLDRKDKRHANYGRLCLLGRRLIERGVRFVTLYCGGSTQSQNSWDGHGGLKANHRHMAAICDQPIAALLTDLQARGLLEDTLVVWTTEFGRTPTAEGSDGRDHNIAGFTIWMAGGGMTPGISYGSTDEIGFKAAENPVRIADLHATILWALGIDANRLTYYHNGLERKLTGADGGRVIHEIM